MAAKKNTSIDIAFSEFDTMVGKFFEQSNITFKDVVKPDMPKSKAKRKQTPLNMNNNPFRIQI